MRRVRTPPRIAPRTREAHKASVGTVLVVGGSRDMRGAVALAALGALRAGAGLVRMAVPASIQPTVAGLRAEATSSPLPEGPEGGLAPDALAPLHALLEGWDALVLGPGAGRADETVRFLAEAAAKTKRPLVLDADGLFALGTKPEGLRARTAPAVITPHEGEAGRLLDVRSAEVRADRDAAALRLAERSGAVVVLKGPGTLVTDGERMYRCPRGGPHLASGGTGDVLAGALGAFVAGLPDTGGDVFGAACAAVWAHAAAADRLAAKRGDRGILASDVAHALPAAVATLVRAGSGASRGRPSR